MILEQRGHTYPSQTIQVIELPAELSSSFPKPAGQVEDVWPPLQLTYLGNYVAAIGGKTVLIEGHYIDRDYIDDVALFYARSLRAYPNYCYRLHFFSAPFDNQRWRSLATETDAGTRQQNRQFLQDAYLGFTVVRPLAGAPIGRTVLKTFPERTPTGEIRSFGGIRDYAANVSGIELHVRGLAFQQQDQGVSACATTALWSALQRVAPQEGLPVPTPADITEAASRYVLEDGRSLPSAGLSIFQICEATRAAGLSPLLIQGVSLDQDRAQILAYTTSGFPPVLAIQPLGSPDGHAVCAVGVKLGSVAPGSDPTIHYRDTATAVCGVYLHDDRLGPYASAQLESHTLDQAQVRTKLNIRWPGDQATFNEAILKAIIVPVPPKLRLTVARMRGLAAAIAQGTALVLPEFKDAITVNCLYKQGTSYRENAFSYGLSEDGLYKLVAGMILSRYIGVIELSVPGGALLDILIDATETQANPSVLALVRRKMWPAAQLSKIAVMVQVFGGECLT